MAGLADALGTKLLECIVAKTSYTMPTSPLFLALTTVTVVHTDTAASITEATYTGYARKSVAGTDWNAAVPGSPNSISNLNAITFAACTAGGNTLVGYALCTTASGAGAIQAFGTLPNLVVSVTQQPVNFAAGALVITDT